MISVFLLKINKSQIYIITDSLLWYCEHVKEKYHVSEDDDSEDDFYAYLKQNVLLSRGTYKISMTGMCREDNKALKNTC